MKVYTGKRVIEIHNNDASKGTGIRGRCDVVVNGQSLKSVWKNIENTFEWGYAGVAPTNLAISILADLVGETDIPEEIYIPFRNDVVSKFPYESWLLSEQELRDWLTDIVNKLMPPKESEHES